MKKYKKIPYSDDLVEDCLKLIKNNPNITNSQIAKKLNKSPSTIHRLLTFLRKEGLIPSLKKGSASLTSEEYPEEEEENETIEKLKEENEELKEQIKTLQNQINYANFEIIKRITYLEPLLNEEGHKINELELKIQNTYDYKERLFLIERLREHKLNYAKLLKELETLKSFLKSK
jgi:Mn-dependent DtxR family transcriptional regulator